MSLINYLANLKKYRLSDVIFQCSVSSHLILISKLVPRYLF